ncbi:MAG: hypothetical protein ACLR23_10205 [Clostridia bacterium]
MTIGSGQRAKETNSPPAQSKRPNRRRNGMKIARRLGEERQRPAGKRWQILRRHSRDELARGETG